MKYAAKPWASLVMGISAHRFPFSPKHLVFEFSTTISYRSSRWAMPQQVPTLDMLLETSDMVTLHVPATPDTVKMVGANEIAKMKRGSLLLNLSRGNVVDIDALKVALLEGQLRGAGVDVFQSNLHPIIILSRVRSAMYPMLFSHHISVVVHSRRNAISV